VVSDKYPRNKELLHAFAPAPRLSINHKNGNVRIVSVKHEMEGSATHDSCGFRALREQLRPPINNDARHMTIGERNEWRGEWRNHCPILHGVTWVPFMVAFG
jgi:hypothetical protein